MEAELFSVTQLDYVTIHEQSLMPGDETRSRGEMAEWRWRDGKKAWGCEQRRVRWEKETAGLPGLQSLSVIQCVSQPIPRLIDAGSLQYLRRLESKHPPFTPPPNTQTSFFRSWKYPFYPRHSLIRFYHHSDAFLCIFLCFLTSVALCHSVAPADLLAVSLATAASCLSVCVAMEGRAGVVLVAAAGSSLTTIKWPWSELRGLFLVNIFLNCSGIQTPGLIFLQI